MSVIIQKFGGTSLANLAQIEKASQKVLQAQQEGHQVVVVTSAMAGVTNELVSMAQTIGPGKTAERDALISSGEQVTASLMALCLQKQGKKSRSFMAWQLPIDTNDAYGQAWIHKIHTAPLQQWLAEGGIAVVPGFQGLSPQKRLTTLGRGGSDITALALAVFLKRDLPEKVSRDISCTIFTDVDGVHTTDPSHVPHAGHIPVLSYEWMHRIALKGAKVLHPHALVYAKEHAIPLVVRSSFSDAPGTRLQSLEENTPPFFLTALKGFYHWPSHAQTTHANLIKLLWQKHTEALYQNPRNQDILLEENALSAITDPNLKNLFTNSQPFAAIFLQGPALSTLTEALAHNTDTSTLATFCHNHFCIQEPSCWTFFVEEATLSQKLQSLYAILYESEKISPQTMRAVP